MSYTTHRTTTCATALLVLLVAGCTTPKINAGYSIGIEHKHPGLSGRLTINGTFTPARGLDVPAKAGRVKAGQPVAGETIRVSAVPNTVGTSMDPYEEIYAVRGAAYRTVVPWSFYKTPILDNGQPRGRSRRHGDASHHTQRTVIDLLRREAVRAGLTLEQQAMVLAIAKVESGFNPDAAAGTSSALGIGQFIRKTGEAYGLNDDTRFDIVLQARALVMHTRDNFKAAAKAGLPMEFVYARHHDGDFKNTYGGVDLSRKIVMPLLPEMRRIIASTPL